MDYSDNLARLERDIGHVFRNKLIGLESLNSDRHQIFHNGQTFVLRPNGELAIRGDNVMDTVLIDMWDRSYDSQGL
jgi:hypothetical protein